jgi:perosamine synthetase
MVQPRVKLNRVNALSLWAKGFWGRLNCEGSAAQGRFEAEFCRVTGLDHIVPVSRARMALYFAFRAAITPERNQVVLCPYTIIDVVNMVIAAGAEPVFVDSRPDSPHPDLCVLQAAATDKTAAVMITHYHSNFPDITPLAHWCANKSIALIEDCAISLCDLSSAGALRPEGDFAAFSFGLFKTIAAPYGGGLWVRDQQLRADITGETLAAGRVQLVDLQPYLKRAVMMQALLHPFVFNLVLFPVIWLGNRFAIRAILSRLNNDPDPGKRRHVPNSWYRQPSDAQFDSWAKQLTDAAAIIAHQRAIAAIHADAHVSDIAPGCYNKSPVTVPAALRDTIHRELVLHGYDNSSHFYRNCNTVSDFAAYRTDTPNLDTYDASVIVLPNHQGISAQHAKSVVRAIALLIETAGEKKG